MRYKAAIHSSLQILKHEWRHDAITFGFLNSIDWPTEQTFNLSKNRKWIPVDGVFGFYYFSIPFPSICKQSIPIYISIGIDNRYKSITTRIFAIDWSSIININRLIDIDCHRLSILPFGYPGQCHNEVGTYCAVSKLVSLKFCYVWTGTNLPQKICMVF